MKDNLIWLMVGMVWLKMEDNWIWLGVGMVWLVVSLSCEAADCGMSDKKDQAGHVVAWFWPVILLLAAVRGIGWLSKEVWKLSRWKW